MICPKCRQSNSQVINTRECFESIRRRRECLVCGYRFTTFERTETPKLYVIKKDGRREQYNREKLKRGLNRAFEKREISQDEIDKLTLDLEKSLYEQNEKEIHSKFIGEKVMEKLQKIDKIAYIRFASVYRSFADIKDFESEIKKFH